MQVNKSDGTAAESAKVEFKLYNYAEFYPIATILTDNKGTAKFTTGLGDLLVWASKDGYFDFKKLHVASTDTLHLVLSGKRKEPDTELMDLVPPAVSKPLQPVSEAAKKSTTVVWHSKIPSGTTACPLSGIQDGFALTPCPDNSMRIP